MGGICPRTVHTRWPALTVSAHGPRGRTTIAAFVVTLLCSSARTMGCVPRAGWRACLRSRSNSSVPTHPARNVRVLDPIRSDRSHQCSGGVPRPIRCKCTALGPGGVALCTSIALSPPRGSVQALELADLHQRGGDRRDAAHPAGGHGGGRVRNAPRIQPVLRHFVVSVRFSSASVLTFAGLSRAETCEKIRESPRCQTCCSTLGPLPILTKPSPKVELNPVARFFCCGAVLIGTTLVFTARVFVGPGRPGAPSRRCRSRRWRT